MACFKKYFHDHQHFQLCEGLFLQPGFQVDADFIDNYLKLRKKEGRLYDDRTVFTLPEPPDNNSLRKEWAIRTSSADRLIKYFKKKHYQKIIEVGCGNGWLTNYISKSLDADLCGIDVNKLELEQAGRLFSTERLNFVFADINSESLDSLKTDVFILAGAVQYFSGFKQFIKRLLSLLNPKGEIHILDSPFYSNENWAAAKATGDLHFKKSGVHQLKNYYFYQTWESISSFQYRILYNPSSLGQRLARVVKYDSPFPWIKIINQ